MIKKILAKLIFCIAEVDIFLLRPFLWSSIMQMCRFNSYYNPFFVTMLKHKHMIVGRKALHV